MKGPKILLLFSCFVFSVRFSCASTLRIGLYYESKITSVVLTPELGTIRLFASDTVVPMVFDHTSLLTLNVVNDSIQLATLDRKIGSFLFLKIVSDSSLIKLKAAVPSLKEKICRGNYEIRMQNGALFIVNVITVEDYVAGVVEAEVGSKLPGEFYKAQCIITRTYALSHLRRHEAENFNLCDKVHCQVYSGVGKRNPFIVSAALQTKDMVLIDSTSELITAAFYSNCGGETANSEDVWNKRLPYLRSVTDTFCLKQRNAAWKKEVGRQEWLAYFKKNSKAPIPDSIACNFAQPHRAVYVTDKASGIRFTNLRTEFGLKSAFFSAAESGDKVILQGRGYGHAVGLCQEGAMQMARKGYDYSQILHFYYRDVNIINLSQKDFFKD